MRQIYGLPFTTANNLMYPVTAMGYFHHVAITAGYGISGLMYPNTTVILLHINDNTVGATRLTFTEASDDMLIHGSITYKSA